VLQRSRELLEPYTTLFRPALAQVIVDDRHRVAVLLGPPVKIPHAAKPAAHRYPSTPSRWSATRSEKTQVGGRPQWAPCPFHSLRNTVCRMPPLRSEEHTSE